MGAGGVYGESRGNLSGPRILHVAPRLYAAVGDSVTLYGTNLQGCTAAMVNGTSATITANTSQLVTLTVPSSATSGPIGLRYGSTWVFSPPVQVFDSTILEIDLRSYTGDPRFRLDNTLATQVGAKLFDVGADGAALLGRVAVTSGNTGQSVTPWDGSIDWTVGFIWRAWTSGGIGNQLGGYLVSAGNPDGTCALRIDNNSGTPRVICCERGNPGTVGAAGETWSGTTINMPWLVDGDEVRIRWACDSPSTHAGAARGGTGYESKVWIYVNGCLVSTGLNNVTQARNALSAFTSLYLGTNLGSATAAFPVPVTYFKSKGMDHAESVPEILILGDSVSANFGVGGGAIGTKIYGADERWTRAGVRNLAASGSRISDAKSAFDAYANRASSSLKAVCLLIGTNDVTAGDNAATITANLQTLVSDIASTNAATKIILAEMTPARNSWSAPQLTVAQTVNANIAGTGGTPITGAHAIVTQTFATGASGWHSGDGVMYSHLGLADYLHPNDAGRERIAGYYRAALVSTGAWQ